LVIGLIVGLKLAGTRQEIRKKAAGGGVTLSISPGDISAAINETFTVGVTVDTGDETVSAAELHLNYDQAKLEAQSITPGNFLPTEIVKGRVGDGSASIILGSEMVEVSPGQFEARPKKGSGILATIAFRTLTPSSSQINFASSTQIAAIGKSENVLQSTNPAQVTVNPPSTDTPIPTPTSIPPTETPVPTNTPIPTITPVPTDIQTATPPPTSPTCAEPPPCVNATPPCPLNTPPSGWCPVTPMPTIIPTATPVVEPTLTTSSCSRKGEGDANCDGSVDGIDYSIWLNSQCNPGAGQTCDNLQADFNADGKVNDDDYKIWFNNRAL
ncbi:hypothetical protein HY945_00965, partial [Candidatus Gottesmanbacteria bacterium]|nr:hypothetical protein [Candidatus Gottesmanbacteria bacterium]